MPKPRRNQPNRGRRPAGRGARSAVGVRKRDDGGWELVLPKAAQERAEDLEEVRLMIDAGETEIATDELRWLLSGCPDLIEAHLMLGEIALATGDAKPADIELARGHFGYAFQIGDKALRQAKCSGPLPGSASANAPWHEAARGLAWCLEKQGQSAMADQVAATVKRFDPSDPAGVGPMLDDLRSGGLPVVELG